MTTTWKKTERTIAKRLNGRRTGATGRATADVVSERFAVEVKHRQQLPEWLKEALAQAVAAADPTQLPIVVLHEAGRRHDGDLVLMRLADFEQTILQTTCAPKTNLLE
ncbi:MAG: hypothetical protein KatS3mg046_137 [Bellilinea sp.]|nr:MAG: hypothetical protein KatS3mg046_137 [Bellilinea sp.]